RSDRRGLQTDESHKWRQSERDIWNRNVPRQPFPIIRTTDCGGRSTRFSTRLEGIVLTGSTSQTSFPYGKLMCRLTCEQEVPPPVERNLNDVSALSLSRRLPIGQRAFHNR